MTDNLSHNELIAEFMGAKIFKEEYGGSGALNRTWQIDTPHEGRQILWGHEMKYAKSWDWLMPVVEKIILMDGVHVTLDAFELSIYHKNERFKTTNDDTLIGAVYGPVVEFIKFLNETKPV